MNSACMHAQAMSAWLASSDRLASNVKARPLAVMVLRMAMKLWQRSVHPASNSKRPARITLCAFMTMATLDSTE